MRAPYQVLVFPYIQEDNKIYYALFYRKDLEFWQGITGGGEDNEMPLMTAKREAFEEAGISKDSEYTRLSSIATVPVVNVCGFKWGEDILVLPEFTFGVSMDSREIKISHEHTEYKWLEFDAAIKMLKWDSNKTALWELDYRLKNQKMDGSKKTSKISRNISTKNYNIR